MRSLAPPRFEDDSIKREAGSVEPGVFILGFLAYDPAENVIMNRA